MSVILLLIIYLIFISLGLPDSLIGSSWPAISQSLNVSESAQGIISFVSAVCTVISSFSTGQILKKISEKWVVIGSIFLTCIGLVCLSFSSNFIFLVLSMIPLGFGGGAIDTTLNNYVALNYKAIHLNWLHAFWAIGASTSPLILSIFLSDINGWRSGALVLAAIQFSIFVIALCSISLWKMVEKNDLNREEETSNLSFLKSFKIRGVAFALIAFFAYIALESIAGVWFSSMMVFGLKISEDVASSYTSMFYIGIMIGRLISGVVSLKISDKNMIRIGESILFIGTIILMMNFSIILMPIGLFIIGLGCGPIYPSIVHATPIRFTKKLSKDVMAIQTGCAYIANFTALPLFGVVAKSTSFLILPYVILAFFILLALCNELVLIKTKDKEKVLEILRK